MDTQFGPKGAAALLAEIQAYYPQVSNFVWNSDGTATVTSPAPLTTQAQNDIIQIIVGPNGWQAS